MRAASPGRAAVPHGEFWRSRDLPHLEARRSCRENSCYRPHTHDALSIGLVDAGASVLTGRPGHVARLRPGDVVVVPAGHVHSCNPERGRWLYRMVHLDQAWALSHLPHGHGGALLHGIGVFRGGELHRRVRAWCDLLFTDPPAARVERSFVDLGHGLVAAVPVHHLPGGPRPALLTGLAPVLHRLRHDVRTPALADLAADAGLPVPQLSRTVARATGLTPVAWRQNVRVEAARRLLREGVAVADTAHELGFFDQSHFHKVFRAHVATTPGRYRA